MPDTRTYYVISDDNCKFESMTREQILAAITQAIEQGEISDIDTGFVTKLKEMNRNNALKFWIGTTAEYNAIQTKETNCFYILSDDTELEDIETEINNFRSELDGLSENVESLTEAVDENTSDIRTLQGESETYGRNFAISNAKKDYPILNQSVSYSDDLYIPLSFPHLVTEEYNGKLTDYRIVKVVVAGNEILCNVYKESDNVAYIRGANGGNASQSTLVFEVVNLKCDISDDDINYLVQNHTVLYNTASGTIAQLTITKIIGVE